MTDGDNIVYKETLENFETWEKMSDLYQAVRHNFTV